MKSISRQKFLESSSKLMGLAMLSPFLEVKRNKLKLSFSTLGCPAWDFDKITSFAAANGYQGLEMRGYNGEIFLPKASIFSENEIAITLQKMKSNNLKFVDLGSGCYLHFKDKTLRIKNLDEGKRYVELAEKLNCPNIRVFPNDLPKDQDEKETIGLITSGLQELAAFAKGSNVNILMETHGKVVYADVIFEIMQSCNHPQIGLVWDIWNMWSVTKESPLEVYKKLKPYIKHTHFKDGLLNNGKPQYVPFGDGEAPNKEAIHALLSGGYQGFYSFEWEKLWHPELAEPDVPFTNYPKVFLNLSKK